MIKIFIGEQLLKPEKGWKRIKYSDLNINYVGNWYELDNEYGTNVDGNIKRFYTTQYDDYCEFNHKFKSFRLISTHSISHSDLIEIIIDGVKYYFSIFRNSLQTSTLSFEKRLYNGIHNVKIINKKNDKYLILDCFDFIYSNFYYLIIDKSNNLYTIKPEFYKNKSFIKLDLLNPTKEDFEKYGFEDLNELITLQNYNGEHFRPIDKFKDFGNNFDILIKEI